MSINYINYPVLAETASPLIIRGGSHRMPALRWCRDIVLLDGASLTVPALRAVYGTVTVYPGSVLSGNIETAEVIEVIDGELDLPALREVQDLYVRGKVRLHQLRRVTGDLVIGANAVLVSNLLTYAGRITVRPGGKFESLSRGLYEVETSATARLARQGL